MKFFINRWLQSTVLIFTSAVVFADSKTFDNGRYYLKIGAVGAAPTSSTYQYQTDVNTRCLFHSGPEGNTSYITNLHLPEGHQIIGLNYEFYDNDPVGFTAAKIIRTSGTVAGSEEILSVVSSGAAINYQSGYEELMSPHTINNSSGQYFLQFWRANPSTSSDDIQMCQARLVLEPSQ